MCPCGVVFFLYQDLYKENKLFGRDGECALLCDDSEEPDEGIAVCIYPTEIIMSQDDYL